MSLKAFHILFVVISTLGSLGFGGWGVWYYRVNGDRSALVCGIISLLVAVVLIWYGRWFLRKLKSVSYL